MKHLCSNCWHYIPPTDGNMWNCGLEYADDDTVDEDPYFCHCTAWRSAKSESKFWKRCVKVVGQTCRSMIEWRKEHPAFMKMPHYAQGWNEALEEMERKFRRMGHVEIEEGKQ